MSNLSRIKSLVRLSNLSFQEIEDSIGFLSKMDEENLAVLVQLFEKKPEWISKFYENVQSKKEAFEKKDKKLWNEILEKEKSDLSEIETEDF